MIWFFLSPSPAGLSNRTARVKINGEIGKSELLRQLLPQGVVLSLMLFLLYIDDLHSVVLETITMALFADDVAVATTI